MGVPHGHTAVPVIRLPSTSSVPETNLPRQVIGISSHSKLGAPCRPVTPRHLSPFHKHSMSLIPARCLSSCYAS